MSWLTVALKWYSTNAAAINPIGTFLGAVGAFITAVILAWAAIRNVRTATRRADIASRRHEEQTNADRQWRIIEIFSKAVGQLASDKIEERLGGIYTLERISKESPDDYWTIVETLTAFVRERARWNWKETDAAAMESMARFDEAAKESGGQQREREPPTDVAAVLTVIKRRDAANRAREEQMRWRLDLRSTDLRGAELVGAHLEGANLREAHLERANLWEAHLERAELGGTEGLTDEQIALANGDAHTELPAGIARPPNWPAAAAEPTDRNQPQASSGGPSQ